MKFLKKERKKKFVARFICHKCLSAIEITDVSYFKSTIYCPFCDNRMWLGYLKDEEYWIEKCVEMSNKNTVYPHHKKGAENEVQKQES